MAKKVGEGALAGTTTCHQLAGTPAADAEGGEAPVRGQLSSWKLQRPPRSQACRYRGLRDGDKRRDSEGH